MIDIAVIGGGPAGLSAAINARARNKNVTVFGRDISKSALYKAASVDNYLGFINISGEQMLTEFFDHATKMGVEFNNRKVLQVINGGDYFMINANNEFFEAKSIIVATGISKGKKITGEDNFVGKGVSYCATCDGMLFRNKTVVLVADNHEGEEDAKFLSEVCKKVYYVPQYENYNVAENIEVITGKPTEILGDEIVSGIKINDSIYNCDGVFFEKETTPISTLVYGVNIENGLISVNRSMETNIPGVFAAGDCTGKPYQVAKAVGEGLTAALQAAYYCSTAKI